MSNEIKRGRNGPSLNLDPDNRSLASKRQAENRANPTPAEKKITQLLDELGERYIFEKIFFTETRFFIVDFYLPKPRKICLEIDGQIHDRTVAYDTMRTNYLLDKRNVKKIVRITNQTAMSLTADQLLKIIS